MPDPEIIEITYSKTPQGQLGARPRKLRAGTEFMFTCSDPGELTIEFKGESPVDGGAKRAKKGQKLKTIAKPGVYAFDCVLKAADGRETRLQGKVGGELEIPPGP